MASVALELAHNITFDLVEENPREGTVRGVHPGRRVKPEVDLEQILMPPLVSVEHIFLFLAVVYVVTPHSCRSATARCLTWVRLH